MKKITAVELAIGIGLTTILGSLGYYLNQRIKYERASRQEKRAEMVRLRRDRYHRELLQLKEKRVRIKGYPVDSPQIIYGRGHPRLSFTIKGADGIELRCMNDPKFQKIRLAPSGRGLLYDSLHDAVKLIEAERTDNDNEPVDLRGRYDNNIFLVSSVRANGLEVILAVENR